MSCESQGELWYYTSNCWAVRVQSSGTKLFGRATPALRMAWRA